MREALNASMREIPLDTNTTLLGEFGEECVTLTCKLYALVVLLVPGFYKLRDYDKVRHDAIVELWFVRIEYEYAQQCAVFANRCAQISV
jgi:hypothetical protein